MANKITQCYGGRASITFLEKRHIYKVSVPELKVFNVEQPSVTGIIGKLDKSAALTIWAVRSMHARLKELLDLTGMDDIPKDLVLSLADVAKDTYRDVKEEAADIGSVVHRVLEQELNARAGLGDHPKLPVQADSILAPDITPEMLAKANASIMAGFQFFDEHNIEIIEAEAVRWSPKYGYLGTGDLIARVDGVPAVLDYKTSKKLYPTVFLQLAAYQMAYQEEFPGAEPIEKRIAINVGRDGVLETKERDNSTFKEDFVAFHGLLKAWRWDVENTDYKPRQAPPIIGPLN